MKTVEIFCGTKSFSKVASKLGHETFTVDKFEKFEPDLISDILEFEQWEIISKKIRDAKVVWLSPPCTTFSMASGNTHWTADRKPKTENAKQGLQLLNTCLRIAEYCDKHNIIYFIENPRARARWFLPIETRKTLWYCQYGDHRAKPTDVWTNLKEWQPKTCANNNPLCNHERAPRGSKTGTQGLKGNMERGIIPEQLFIELFGLIK